ncbi:MAG: hypothetical protein JXL67_06145 [Calditrichaeota bacterium]|nr:hypothetical protein [Calditrichota bacterium]
MGRRDVKSKVKLAVLHEKIQYTATEAIVGVDVSDYHGQTFVVDIGAWTANGLTVTFQHCDDNSTWIDVPAADLDGDNDIAVVTGLADSQIYVGYTGNKKYIGAKITDAATGDAVLGVYIVKSYPSQFPVN